jgi:hypothetical protein
VCVGGGYLLWFVGLFFVVFFVVGFFLDSACNLTGFFVGFFLMGLLVMSFFSLWGFYSLWFVGLLFFVWGFFNPNLVLTWSSSVVRLLYLSDTIDATTL